MASMFSVTTSAVVVGAAALSLTVVWQVVYNLFFSPLRNIPGPFLAKVTPQWLIFVDIAGNRTTRLHSLHQRYGPTIRIGPNEVSFSNADIVKQIYGQNTEFMKAPIYETMSLPPLGIFSLRDKAAHSQRRRLLSHAFAQSNVINSEPLILQHIRNLLARVQKNVGAPLDMLLLFRLTAFDIVGELFLGQSFGGLEADKTPAFLLDMDSHFLASGIQASFPWIYRILFSLPVKSVQEFLGSRERLSQYGEKAFHSYISRYGRDSGRRDLLTKVLSVKKETGTTPLTDRETSVEIGNLVFAGTDTTSSTLTYLFWELARNPSWQDRVCEEIRSKVARPISDVLYYQEVQGLPILDAVINEALRLHPAAPASLQRETPQGGKSMNGYYIPEKTVVSMQCYTTQRDPSAFPEPNTFAPERWLKQATQTPEAQELYMPFSKGSRACLGKSLAVLELNLITAALLMSYKVSLAEDTTEDSMTMTDHFLVIPKGGKCNLVFEPRRGKN